MKKDVKKRLEELGVLVVYLFGSRAIGRQSRLSDLDLGIVLKTSVSGKDRSSLYTKLYQFCNRLLFHSNIILSRKGRCFLRKIPD